MVKETKICGVICSVVDAKNFEVILCLTGQSGREPGPDMSDNRQPRSGRGNFLKKIRFYGEIGRSVVRGAAVLIKFCRNEKGVVMR